MLSRNNPPGAGILLAIVLVLLSPETTGASGDGRANARAVPAIRLAQAVDGSGRGEIWSKGADGSETQSGRGPGIGGTGGIAGGEGEGDGNGIGGTGNYAEGGTGIGGTGIIGTITGFGSIFVNGYEIDYDPGLAVGYKSRTLRADTLRIGQVVAVEAVGEGDRLSAHAIELRQEVAGPIDRIDRAGQSVVVLGQSVDLTNGVIAAGGDETISLTELRVGDWVEVSGWRRGDGVIAATRLDHIASDGVAVLRGTAETVSQDRLTINGRAIDLVPGILPADLRPGREIVVFGAVQRGRLRPRRLALAPRLPFSGRFRRLSIEGVVRHGRGGALTIGRVSIGPSGGVGTIRAGRRLIINGILDGRRILRPLRLRRPILRPRERIRQRRKHRRKGAAPRVRRKNARKVRRVGPRRRVIRHRPQRRKLHRRRRRRR